MSESDAATGNGLTSAAFQPQTGTWLYRFVSWFTRQMMRLLFGVTIEGMENLPRTGPVLIVSNHESYIDPPLYGSMIDTRPLTFVARSGLFGFKPFGWFIGALNAIPLREKESDIVAIKALVKRLEEGGAVLIFPEGSRSPDGRMTEFKRGAALLLRKSKCDVLPAAVDGAHEAWPRGGFPVPRRGPGLYLKFGRLIPQAELARLGPDEALRRLHDEVAALAASIPAKR
ncbi:MAG: 1-acyl-sn-glycerol-3-phosphate acyltransferase [Phycisphaerales bacterium]|nr:1-acyl-sn-glycerol-3-phosphate acyltransferase [Phycisphaerales bacterium]